jgi:translation initiation factor IF-2
MRAAKKAAEDRALSSGRISLEEFSRRANQLAELNVIVKADVHGSSEAVRHAIEQLTTEKVRVRVVHSAVGGITESDVQLAIASKALIVGFNVRAEARAAAEAERAGIQLRFYRIIYELIDDVKRAMVGLLEPERVEEHLGRAVVKKTFVVPKLGTIAGSYVKSGTIKRGSLVRLVRDGVVVFEGKMGSLKRFKDDVKEVAAGYECGIGIEGYNDIKPGDEIEVYQIKEIAPEL